MEHGRNWCLTGWIHKGVDKETGLKDVMDEHGKEITYLGGKLEQTKTDKLHWQAWVQFKSSKYGKSVREIFPSGKWSSLRMRGTAKQNDEYCQKLESKMGEFQCWGSYDIIRADKVKIMQEIIDKIKAGASKAELWRDYPHQMMNHWRASYEMMEVQETEDDKAEYPPSAFNIPLMQDWRKSMIFWGPSGFGKTQFGCVRSTTLCCGPIPF